MLSGGHYVMRIMLTLRVLQKPTAEVGESFVSTPVISILLKLSLSRKTFKESHTISCSQFALIMLQSL